MKKLKWILLTILLLHAGQLVIAQQSASRQQVIQLLERARLSYQQAGALEIGIQYYYANERSPGIHLDSVKATMTLQGDNYRMKMQAVETIVNSRYSITLFEEDQLMYLAKPAATQSRHPLAAMDSLLQQLRDIQYSISQQGQLTVATMEFSGVTPYKKMSFAIDTTTGYLVQSNMLVKTTYLAPDAHPDTLRKDGYDPYSIVETRLSGYKRPVLPVDYFDEKQFFTRKDNAFEVTEPYRNYKIFVATPNL